MRDKFSRWLHKILTTQAEEISCSECFDLVSAYVDLELAGVQTAERLPQVGHHLGQCQVCREEYELLRDMKRQDQEET